MTTYSISAPDGKTYEIEGPAGATDEQVRAEVVRQNPHLSDAPKPKASPPAAMSREETVRNASEMALEGIGGGGRFVTGLGRSAANIGRTFGIGEREDADTKIRDAVLTDTGGGFAGNLAGDAIFTAPIGGAAGKLALKGAGSVLPKAIASTMSSRPVMQSAIGGAAGGAAGAGMTGESAGEGALIGGLFGPAAYGLGRLASGGYNLAKDFTAGPVGQATSYLHKVFGDRAPAVADAVSSLRGLVPGEQVTAGKAALAQNGSFPELKVLETRAAGGEMNRIAAQNNNAQAQVLDNIIEPGRRPMLPDGRFGESDAMLRRKAVTKPLYRDTERQMFNLTPEIIPLFDGDEIAPAVRKARQSLEQARTNAKVGGFPGPARAIPATPPVNPLYDWDSFGLSQGPKIVPHYGRRSGADLMRLKDQITAQINTLVGSMDGPSKLKLSQLQTARNQLDDFLYEQSGSYGVAQDMFRDLSVPQNRADVARELLSTMRTGAAGKNSGSAFVNALDNPATTLRKAGLPENFVTIEQVMGEQMPAVNALRASLVRDARYADLPANESMVPRLMTPARALEETAPPFLNRWMTIARASLKKIGGMSEEKVNEVINSAIRNPQEFADLIRALPPGQRNRLVQYMRENGMSVLPGATAMTTSD